MTRGLCFYNILRIDHELLDYSVTEISTIKVDPFLNNKYTCN